jgi:ABC-type dipeptide/oligopeptide/nickel transport system permease subunit
MRHVRFLAAALLVALVLVGVAGVRPSAGQPTSLIEQISGQDAGHTSPADRLLAPLARTSTGTRTLLGTDEVGRSLALRLGVALGTSLLVAGAAALVAMAIGTAIGTWAGLAGGRIDNVLMRLTEATAGIPAVVVVMVLGAALAPWGLWPVLAAMGLLFWQPVARVVRARAMRLRNEQYVEAARALGVPGWRRLRVHILPGVWPTVLAYGALLVPRLIMLEALLAFLGINAAAAPHSFGRIISGVTSTLTPLSSTFWPVLVPCLVLATFLLLLNHAIDQATEAVAR